VTWPTEVHDLVATVGTPLFGVVGKWRKDGDTWLISLNHIDETVNFTGLVVPVRSKQGTKHIKLGGCYNTFPGGAHYYPGKEIKRGTEDC